jgi:DNA sulfur modification protein DndD
MIISGIKWKNFKSFHGEYEITGIDQNLSAENNVVLFGGTNGAGKTTLLESVFLCLYGIDARNLYPSRGAKYETYITYLHSLLNWKVKEAGLSFSDMSVEIFLKEVPIISNLGRDISIRRRWEFKVGSGEQPVEHLEILEDGKLIADMEDEKEYQDRIHAILPFNVSQFFFFDGEKIQDFASDSDSEFAKSLKDVLGINLYSKLTDDLREVRSRIFKEYSKDAEAQKEVSEREAKRVGLLTENEMNNLKITALREEIENRDMEIDKIDVETRRITFLDPDKRDNYLYEKNQQEQEKETLEGDYINLAKDHLPFILASNLFDELLEQLEDEKRIFQLKAAQAEIEPKITTIIESVFNNNPEPPFAVTPGMRRYFESKIDSALRSLLGGDSLDFDDRPIIHNLSHDEAEKIRRFIFGLNDGVVSVLGQKAEKLKQIAIFLDKVRNVEVRSGSNSDAIQRLFDQKKELSEQIGDRKSSIKRLEEQIYQNEEQIKVLNREITNWQSRSKLNETNKKQLDYCDKLQASIKDFQKQFQASKTTQLEKEILFMWNQLNHKPDLIQTIRILPDSNFEVKLFNAEGSELDKTKLSAGEKEIFAISLLWALIQVSGKKLPILVDTPFGRLDSIHRRNLTKNYFPKASHQVILLSQDEEVVGEYYDLLRPSIAQEFEIKNEGGITTILPGQYPFAKRQ